MRLSSRIESDLLLPDPGSAFAGNRSASYAAGPNTTGKRS